LVDEAIQLDDLRKKTQLELDTQLSEINKISKEIGMLMKDGKKMKQKLQSLKLPNTKNHPKNLPINFRNRSFSSECFISYS
jgi:seryl-tRNA synthetase